MNIKFKDIIQDLESRPKNKPWSTSKNIAQRLKQSHEDVEKLLINHTRNSLKQVRYSNFPAAESLYILWGATKLVGHRKKLNPLQKKDSADKTIPSFKKDEHLYFISHNHKDYSKVCNIAKMFSRNGISPWLAEASITQGQFIHYEITQALQKCDGFVLFISRNALCSTWVRKEFQNIVNQKDKPIFIILDSDDKELMDVFIQWNHESTPTLQSINDSENGQGHCFSFLELLDDFLQKTHQKIYAFSSLISTNNWSNTKFRLTSFNEKAIQAKIDA